MPETPRSTDVAAPAPRQALLLAKLNALKADISAIVRGIVDGGGTVVELHLPAPENEPAWTDPELALARRALLGKYQALKIDFIVRREELDAEAMMAELMKDDVEAPAAPTASDMAALGDTNAELPVVPEPETGKKKPVVQDTSAAAANLLEQIRRAKRKPS
jgi:hypothetical protein